MSKSEALNTPGQSGLSDFHLVLVTDRNREGDAEVEPSLHRSVPSRVSGDRTVSWKMKLLLASCREGLKASRALGRTGKEVTAYVFTLERATGRKMRRKFQPVERDGSQRDRGDDWRFVKVWELLCSHSCRWRLSCWQKLYSLEESGSVCGSHAIIAKWKSPYGFNDKANNPLFCY